MRSIPILILITYSSLNAQTVQLSPALDVYQNVRDFCISPQGNEA